MFRNPWQAFCRPQVVAAVDVEAEFDELAEEALLAPDEAGLLSDEEAGADFSAAAADSLVPLLSPASFLPEASPASEAAPSLPSEGLSAAFFWPPS
ncbi:MAG: hypothetical protein EBV68_11565, partial [Betaproteobacteria bacterium]|nr:hypothetical protein [Betaproteobacteria bacterium]